MSDFEIAILSVMSTRFPPLEYVDAGSTFVRFDVTGRLIKFSLFYSMKFD
jgi:hypothetical protein